MSAAAEIVVVARWQPRDGAFDEVLAIAAALRPLSLAEPGCLAYDAYLGTDLPRSLLLVERYRDAAALAAHRESAHYRAFVVEKALPLLAGREVRLLGAHAPD